MSSERTTCRISGEDLIPLFSLGDIYVSDFLKPDEEPDPNSKVPLSLALAPTSGLVQLTHTADFDAMYRRYWYHSGLNASMIRQLGDIVDCVFDRVDVGPGDLWVDVGCNDGTLMRHVKEGCRDVFCIGVDPATNNCEAAKDVCDVVVNDYFSRSGPLKNYSNVKVITSIAMFYDLEDPNSFCADVYDTLADDGVWVIQLSYLPLMIRQMAFDNICHEHLEYYSLECISDLLQRNGFYVTEASLNDTNGGSIRVYARKKGANEESYASAPHRDVAQYQINALLDHEESLLLKSPTTHFKFFDEIESLKQQTVDFVRNAKSDGKTVWAYGASTKGNTLLQYFGLTNEDIGAIAEVSQPKFGLKTVGTNIPIVSEAEMRKANPDYMLMLPWHFVSGFVKREEEYLANGGKFIVPCPNFKIIGG